MKAANKQQKVNTHGAAALEKHENFSQSFLRFDGSLVITASRQEGAVVMVVTFGVRSGPGRKGHGRRAWTSTLPSHHSLPLPSFLPSFRAFRITN